MAAKRGPELVRLGPLSCLTDTPPISRRQYLDAHGGKQREVDDDRRPYLEKNRGEVSGLLEQLEAGFS